MNWRNNNTLHKLPQTSREVWRRRPGPWSRVSVGEQVLRHPFSSFKFPNVFSRSPRYCDACAGIVNPQQKLSAESRVVVLLFFFIRWLHRSAPARKSPDFFSPPHPVCKRKWLNPSKTTQQKHGILYKWSWKKMLPCGQMSGTEYAFCPPLW